MEESLKNDLRNQLLHCNQELFSKISERKSLVSKIQNLKEKSGDFYLWDIEREIQLFKNFVDRYPQELRLDFIYSVIIEEQALNAKDYPKWSAEDHLLESNGKFYCRINPILLYFRDPDIMKKLKLKPFFENRLRNLLK